MRLHRIWPLVAVIGLASIAGMRMGQAMAADDAEYTPLRGLSSVYIRIAKLRPHEVAAGLSEKDLQQDLEATLAATGLRTLSALEWQKTPGRPVLVGQVVVLRDTADKADKVNLVILALMEDGMLIRSPKQKRPVVIYHENTFGVGTVADMRSALRRLGAQFAEEYREQNRK